MNTIWYFIKGFVCAVIVMGSSMEMSGQTTTNAWSFTNQTQDTVNIGGLASSCKPVNNQEMCSPIEKTLTLNAGDLIKGVTSSSCSVVLTSSNQSFTFNIPPSLCTNGSFGIINVNQALASAYSALGIKISIPIMLILEDSNGNTISPTP